MGFFTAESAAPESVLDVLIGSWIFMFFGVMVFIGAMRSEETYGKPAKWWPLCFILIGIGIIMGLQKVISIRDTAYAATVFSRKITIAHYLAFFVPVLSVGLIFLYKNIRDKRQSQKIY
jgi:hypothetical protein